MLMRFTCARSDFQLAKSLVLLLRAFAFRHIDVRSDHLDKFSIRGEQRMAGRFDIFDRPVGKYDSELECEISLLMQRLLGLYIYSLAIIWMDPLQHSFPVREALQRIKSPDLVTFLRPVDRPCRVEGQGAGVAQPLCFGQIGFAASECLFGPLSLGDVPSHAAVADKTSRLVKYRQPGDGYITLAAVGRRSRELEISEWQVGIRCVSRCLRQASASGSR